MKAQRLGLEDDNGLLTGGGCLGATRDSLAKIWKALARSPVVEQAVAADGDAAGTLV
jgi:hypothetical protein